MEVKQTKETICERIRQILAKEGHSVNTFAKKLGMAWMTVSNIVDGRNAPSYDNIVKIIESFDWVDANWLVMGEKTIAADNDKKKLYSVIEAQQKTIEAQQKTIDRLATKLVSDAIASGTQKATAAG